ncbi:hypothetical protein PIB30_007084 [Stylosanthes scabra]|uniref:Cupin type-1 domain-containing protein n=1 Tax=Stylosanthes scabra TaxID=79078 RepID=A0ABU6R6G5_9FABA|nr:hypothetical protein [Stylosanthes scabra]
MSIILFFLFALVSSTSIITVQSFCVADLKAAQTPSGYLCKAPESVKVDDFVFTGLDPQNTTNGISISPAFVDQIPGLNGLGFAAARLDMDVGGVVPMHTHPDASEMLIIVHGTMNSGKGKATVYLAFSSSNPSVQLVDVALFGNNLSSDLVTKTTYLDLYEVKKLKGVFGGSG